MSQFELPRFLREFPITNAASAAHVVDTVLSAKDRNSDSILLLICDHDAHPLQPVVISDVPWRTDRDSQERCFQFLSTFVDVKVLVALASGVELDVGTIRAWRESAEKELGDRMLFFMTATPHKIQDHPAGVRSEP